MAVASGVACWAAAFVCLFVHSRGERTKAAVDDERSEVDGAEPESSVVREQHETGMRSSRVNMDQKAPVALLTPFPFLLQPPTIQHRLESEFTVR